MFAHFGYPELIEDWRVEPDVFDATPVSIVPGTADERAIITRNVESLAAFTRECLDPEFEWPTRR